MEEIYRRDLIAFKGRSLRGYRFRQFIQRWWWTLVLPAIIRSPFREKNRKVVSILGMLSLSAVTTLATAHA